MKKLAVLACTIVLLGAGCFSPPAEPAQPEPSPKAEAPADNRPVAEQPEEPAAEVSVDLNISMDAGNFFFSPSTITAEAGQTVHVTIESNEGFHTFVIDAINFKRSTKTGETMTFVAPTTPGTYEFYCDIGSHQSMGMTGTLIVK